MVAVFSFVRSFVIDIDTGINSNVVVDINVVVVGIRSIDIIVVDMDINIIVGDIDMDMDNVGSNDVEVPVWPSVSVNSDTSSRNSCAYDPSRQLGGSSDNVSKSRSRTVASSGFNSPFGNERSQSHKLNEN